MDNKHLHKHLHLHVRRMTISADIWTQAGMRHSYLGISAQYYQPKTTKIETCLLACREISGRHIATKIRDLTLNILAEWEIDLSKVFRFLSDSGSNMIAAYRDAVLELAEDQNETEELEVEENDDIVIEENGEDSTTTQSTRPLIRDQFLEDEDDSDTEIDARILSDMDLVQNDVDDYVGDEETQSIQFENRLSCIVHKLMCVLRTAIDGDDDVGQLKRSIYKLVAKFSKSTLATQMLLEKQRLQNISRPKKLIFPAQTRWNSFLFVSVRLVDLKPFVISVCGERDWSFGSDWSWRKIELLCDLLKPFQKFTDLTQGDYSTIHSVIPVLLDLKASLQASKFSVLGNVTITLESELDWRFKSIMDPNSDSVDPIYMVASYLNPVCAKLLPQSMLDFTKSELTKLVKIEIDRAKSSPPNEPALPETEQIEDSPENMEYLQTMFPNFASSVTSLAPDLPSNSSDSGLENQPSADKMVDAYFKLVSSLDLRKKQQFDLKNPISFWQKHKEQFPYLSELAFDILSIPATTAFVERAFSAAGIASIGRRALIGPKSLENEVILKVNKHFLL